MIRMVRSFLFLFVAFLAPATWAASTVEGVYKANGQDAKLAFALAYPSEAHLGKPTTRLVFSEQDASAEKRPDISALFGKFGSSFVVLLMKDGDSYTVIGSDFGHQGLKHAGASAIGLVDAKDVKITDGRISGRLITAPDSDISDQPVVVDLKFDVALSKAK